MDIDITNKLTKEERESILKSSPFYHFNQVGKCMHCGLKYNFNESRIVKNNNKTYIMCPDRTCEGTVLDFIPLKDQSL